MKCKLCSMQATYRFVKSDGLVEFYCDHHAPAGAEKLGAQPSVFKTYRPVIVAFIGIIALTGLIMYLKQGTMTDAMRIFMAAFFLVFGGLKAFTWSNFASSFGTYDPLAKQFPLYAWVYPAIELALAAGFFCNWQIALLSFITIGILSVTTYGILGAIKRGETLQCVCLGSLFTLPLGWVTVFENAVMIVMALVMIVSM